MAIWIRTLAPHVRTKMPKLNNRTYNQVVLTRVVRIFSDKSNNRTYIQAIFGCQLTFKYG